MPALSAAPRSSPCAQPVAGATTGSPRSRSGAAGRDVPRDELAASPGSRRSRARAAPRVGPERRPKPRLAGGAHERVRRARAGRSACPTVRGLPVSSQTTGAPSDRSQSSASSSRSQTSRCSSGSPSGHSARKSSNERYRQTTQRREQHRPARPVALLEQRTGRRRARAPAPARRGRPSRRRRPRRGMRHYVERERRLVLDVLDASRARAPRGRRRACSARRRSPRPRRRAPPPRRGAGRPSRRGRRGGSGAAAPARRRRPRGTRPRRRRPRRAARPRARRAGSKPSSRYCSAVLAGRPSRARRGRGRTRRRSAPRRARAGAPRRPRTSTRPSARSSSSPSGSLDSASARSDTRRRTCLSGAGSRGPSAANSVSLPRRASVPTSVNLSVRSIDVHVGVRRRGSPRSCRGRRPRGRCGQAWSAPCGRAYPREVEPYAVRAPVRIGLPVGAVTPPSALDRDGDDGCPSGPA